MNRYKKLLNRRASFQRCHGDQHGVRLRLGLLHDGGTSGPSLTYRPPASICRDDCGKTNRTASVSLGFFFRGGVLCNTTVGLQGEPRCFRSTVRTSVLCEVLTAEDNTQGANVHRRHEARGQKRDFRRIFPFWGFLSLFHSFLKLNILKADKQTLSLFVSLFRRLN